MALPGLPSARRRLIEAVALAQPSRLLARSREPARLAMLVHRVNDPIDTGVAPDGFVLGVNEDDFVVLVRAILVDPVRVQDAQIGAASAYTLFCCRLQRALVLELVDSLVCRFSFGEGVSIVMCWALDGDISVDKPYVVWALVSSALLDALGLGR